MARRKSFLDEPELEKYTEKKFFKELRNLNYTYRSYNLKHLPSIKHTHCEYDVSINYPEIGDLYFKMMYMTPHRIVNVFRVDEKGKRIKSIVLDAFELRLTGDSCVFEEETVKRIVAIYLHRFKYQLMK